MTVAGLLGKFTASKYGPAFVRVLARRVAGLFKKRESTTLPGPVQDLIALVKRRDELHELLKRPGADKDATLKVAQELAEVKSKIAAWKATL